MVRNPSSATVCPACEAPRPGQTGQSVVAAEDNGPGDTAPGSGIGPGGFTFGAPTSASTSSREAPEASAVPSGADEAVGQTAGSSTGFTLGTTSAFGTSSSSTATNATSGFSFGAPKVETKPSSASVEPTPTKASGFSFGHQVESPQSKSPQVLQDFDTSKDGKSGPSNIDANGDASTKETKSPRDDNERAKRAATVIPAFNSGPVQETPRVSKRVEIGRPHPDVEEGSGVYSRHTLYTLGAHR